MFSFNGFHAATQLQMFQSFSLCVCVCCGWPAQDKSIKAIDYFFHIRSIKKKSVCLLIVHFSQGQVEL